MDLGCLVKEAPQNQFDISGLRSYPWIPACMGQLARHPGERYAAVDGQAKIDPDPAVKEFIDACQQFTRRFGIIFGNNVFSANRS